MGKISKQNKLERKDKNKNKNIEKKSKVDIKIDKTQRIMQFVEKYSFAIMFVLFSIILFSVFGDFITLKKVFLFKGIASDSITTFFPSFYQSLANKGTELSYIFTSGMGRGTGSTPDFISLFISFVFSPLQFWSWLANAENAHYMYFIRQLEKIIYVAILFYFYMRLVNVKKFNAIIGSLLMTFSGYVIIGSIWVHHVGQVVGILWILIAFELMFMRKIWFLFPIMIAYIGSVGFFYINAVFLTVYVIFRYFDERTFSVKGFAKYVGIVGGFTLLGLVVRIPAIYNEVIRMLNLPRVSGDISKVAQMQEISVWTTGNFLHNITAVLRFFGNDLLGTGSINPQIIQGKRYLISDFKGYANYYEAPMFYIGLLTLILVPQAIATVNRRRKITYIVVILFWIFPVIFPYFRRAYFLFFGDYYRSFSLFLPFTLLFIALRAFDNIQKINIPVLIASIFTLIFILFFNWFSSERLQELSLITSPIKENIIIITALFIVIYGILLAAIHYLKNYQSGLMLVLLLVVGIELIYMASTTIDNQQAVTTVEFKSKTGYNDYTVEAVKYLKSIDKSFYRTEKDYQSGNAVHGSLNDSEIQGYFGTSSYSSFQDKAYIDFIMAMGIANKHNEASVRWSRGLRGKPLLQITANVKYHLSKSKEPSFLRFGYTPIKEFNDVKILKNTLYLPIGFTYDKYIKRSEFDSLTNIAKDAVLLQAVVLNDSIADKSILQHHNINPLVYNSLSTDSVTQWRNRLMQDTLAIKNWKQDNFAGKISLKQPKLLYFSILKNDNWKLKINGVDKKLQTCNIGFSGIALTPGDYNIELYFDNTPKGIVQYTATFILIFAIIILTIWFATTKRRKNNNFEL